MSREQYGQSTDFLKEELEVINSQNQFQGLGKDLSPLENSLYSLLTAEPLSSISLAKLLFRGTSVDDLADITCLISSIRYKLGDTAIITTHKGFISRSAWIEAKQYRHAC